MNKLKIIFSVTACLFFLGSMAQSLDRSVVATAGNYSTATGISLSWTIGQAGPVQTASTASLILTQGFQQADIIVTSIDPDNEGELQITVFLNPSY